MLLVLSNESKWEEIWRMNETRQNSYPCFITNINRSITFKIFQSYMLDFFIIIDDGENKYVVKKRNIFFIRNCNCCLVFEAWFDNPMQQISPRDEHLTPSAGFKKPMLWNTNTSSTAKTRMVNMSITREK